MDTTYYNLNYSIPQKKKKGICPVANLQTIEASLITDVALN